MRLAAGGAEALHLVVERLPVAPEHVAARDDDVDLRRPRRRPRPRSRATPEREAARGRRGTRSRPRRPGCRCRSSAVAGGGDHVVVDADRADGDAEHRAMPRASSRSRRIGLARLAAEPAHPLLGVVAGERGQVDAGDRLEQPGRLPVLLDRAAGGERRGAALDRRGVGGDGHHLVEVERHAGVADVCQAGRGAGAFTSRAPSSARALAARDPCHLGGVARQPAAARAASTSARSGRRGGRRSSGISAPRRRWRRRSPRGSAAPSARREGEGAVEDVAGGQGVDGGDRRRRQAPDGAGGAVEPVAARRRRP